MPLNADAVIETFGAATEENQLCEFRHHQVIHLPEDGELLAAGDLHDHRRNFDKLVRMAKLDKVATRHVLFQEVIHGDHFGPDGAEESWRMLFQVAELKARYPNQVHILLSNHDLAQIHGEGIMKSGYSVCESFNLGVRNEFGDRTLGVVVAMTEFLLSLPLAVRTAKGLFFCHSLPTDDQLPDFDFSIFDRPLVGADYRRRTGAVYQLIWGRGTTATAAATFADRVNATVLVTGHQPQDRGYLVNGDRHLIIASEHNQGVFLPLDLGKTYDIQRLLRRMKRFVAIDA